MKPKETEPIEGATYLSPNGDQFTVLYKGQLHGSSGFIAKWSDLRISGYPLSWWGSEIFKSPELIAKGKQPSYCDSFGMYYMSLTRWCRAIKHTSGELEIILLKEIPEWVNQKNSTKH